ncbi:MAG TPA: hypothetical protein VGR51_03610, partial [Thermoplasmata archaeon]|nr:hypothetical protein [Thermoplasmata archaeon]
MAALALASSASADRLGTSNVAYYPGGPAEVTLHLGESVDYPWVFYNGENASVYVNLTAEVSPVGAVAMAYPSFTILAPGEWAQIVLRITAPDEGAHQTGSVLIHLTAVNLQTYAVAVQDATLPITLIGITPPDDP